MTHQALEVAKECKKQGINLGVIDVFILKPLNQEQLWISLGKYSTVITLEEGFINKGGLDTSIANLLREKESNSKLITLGFSDKFVSDIGDRNYLHKINKLDIENIADLVKNQ
jgi:transketolase